MARPASVAVAGYYPTPNHLVPRIAALMAPDSSTVNESLLDDRSTLAIVDPCAGDGEAAVTLSGILTRKARPRLYGIEMESTRFVALKKRCTETNYYLTENLLHSDAFRVTFRRPNGRGVSVLFLNPPYDTDRVYGRLEHKFLARFSSTLMDGGILLFVVPFYALAASAAHLATEYTDVRCFRFPDGDFDVYKQVVVFARKTETRVAPDAKILALAESWSNGVDGVPELPNVGDTPLCVVPTSSRYHDPLEGWTERPVDLTSLTKKIRPWVQSARLGAYAPVNGILPDLPIEELMLRKYPLATPPRPAHIAAGIASGIFNGSRVDPSDPTTGLPSLLVKGVFDQEYRTVEEKTNKEGEVTALVQVQQPKLVATVLDLSTYRYHTLLQGGNDAPSIDGLTFTGLLKHYGDSLMRVMETQCPILYDPRKDGDAVPLAETTRQPFVAQAHAAKAIVRLLGGPGLPLKKRRGKAAILLGEIGSGKSTVSLVSAKTVGSKRPLVMCPPHLLTSWRNEVASVMPEAEVRVLGSVTDIEDLARDKSDKIIVAVVSRETAKLSHGWLGVGDTCPKCGSPTPADDLAKKRSRCAARRLEKTNGPIARTVIGLAHYVMRSDPKESTVNGLLRTGWDSRKIAHYQKLLGDADGVFEPLPSRYFDDALDEAVDRFDEHERVRKAIVWMLHSIGDDYRTAAIAERFMSMPVEKWAERKFGEDLLLLMKPGSDLQKSTARRYMEKDRTVSWNPVSAFDRNIANARNGYGVTVGAIQLSIDGDTIKLGSGVEPRSAGAAKLALNVLAQISGMRWSKQCGEFLFQADASPRRVALAHHITKHYPNLFDFLILDEAHEYATEGSAQERSAHRLTGMGLPVVIMTGSMMNGYAESLFTNMWSVSPAFRAEFGREDKQRFIDRYGYRKRIVQQKDSEGAIVSFGAMSDRVTKTERVIGNAPGVLPLFLLRHLLTLSVTLHKSDLALELPPCRQEKCLVEPSEELYMRFRSLQSALISRITSDRFRPEYAGKLFGQLAELPSYLDRATSDTGNVECGDYEIRYPESLNKELVASQAAFGADEIQPKEQWIIDRVKSEIAEGRNVMVFAWHVTTMPRLARLISEAIGEKVPILHANKVPTARRQDWITVQVVNKNARCMVTNPVAIQTGLNNLVHFATEIWVENPACNPIIFRQAIGRVDRIGQKIETRILVPIYKGTLQEQLYELLLQKVAVSISTDGLDPESALLAAGIGDEEYMSGLSIGKQLYSMLSDD